MTEFRVVDDSLREGRGTTPKQRPETLAVLEGKTIFIPLNGKRSSEVSSSWASRISSGSKRTLSCRSYTTEIDGVAGVVIWAIPREKAAS